MFPDRGISYLPVRHYTHWPGPVHWAHEIILRLKAAGSNQTTDLYLCHIKIGCNLTFTFPLRLHEQDTVFNLFGHNQFELTFIEFLNQFRNLMKLSK